MKKEKTFLKETLIGTIAAVLGGIILAMIPSGQHSLIGKFSDFLNQSSASIWEFLKSPSKVPTGIILLIVVFLLVVVGFQLRTTRSLSKQLISITRPRKPMLHDYREDTISGVLWRWDQISPTIPSGLSAFCPVCRTRLVCNPFYQHAKDSTFFCETGHKDVAKLDGDLNTALGFVWRQIEKKINTGEWKKVAELQRKSVK